MPKIFSKVIFCTLLLISLNGNAASVFWLQQVCLLPNCMTMGQFLAWMINQQVPTLMGDVVGRDMDVPGLGPFGHLGIWDGGQIFEAIPGNSNAIHLNTLSGFKAPSSPAPNYWGVASANIPNYNVYGCFAAQCSNYWLAPSGQVEIVSSRVAIAKRMYQAYLVGADYTISPFYVGAWPGVVAAYSGVYYPPQRGSYRCDTFVIDMLKASVYGSTYAGAYYSYPDVVWSQRVTLLSSGITSPRTVFDTLSSFK